MEHQKKEKLRNRILIENPYDIETFLESLVIASDSGKEILFLDKFISKLRENPKIETTDLSYKVLQDLKLLTIK